VRRRQSLPRLEQTGRKKTLRTALRKVLLLISYSLVLIKESFLLDLEIIFIENRSKQIKVVMSALKLYEKLCELPCRRFWCLFVSLALIERSFKLLYPMEMVDTSDYHILFEKELFVESVYFKNKCYGLVLSATNQIILTEIFQKVLLGFYNVKNLWKKI
jgi:hypothetical protein